jgi:GTP-binding protein HflX
LGFGEADFARRQCKSNIIEPVITNDGRVFLVDRTERKIAAALMTLNSRVAEVEELADTAGYDILYEIIQERRYPDPSYFVGKGKLDEVKTILEENPIEVLLINGEVEPGQHYILENTLKLECVDRIKIVLNIFAKRAHSKEAMLQVEKAKLQYEMPFLKEWIHNAKAGEHPGFLGGGEYAINTYYDLIKKRMKKIDTELKSMKEDQALRRHQRKKKGFYLVCLAGYTNAGKSSLMKKLTGESVIIENKMFSTLSTTTRKMENVKKEILLTDTIGFLENLPHFMIESFRNTIEDIFNADLVLLVLDSSDEMPEVIRKLKTSKGILLPDIDPANIVVVLNKTDLLKFGMKERIDIVRAEFPQSEIVLTSVKDNYGLDVVKSKILEKFTYPVELNFEAPQSGELQSLLSSLYDSCDVTAIEYGPMTKVSLRCKSDDRDRIAKTVIALEGSVIPNPPSKETAVPPEM